VYCTWLLPPAPSPSAPTAKSLTPSPFKSPMFATDVPKLSELAIE